MSNGITGTNGTFTVECWARCPVNPGDDKQILSQGSKTNAFYMGTMSPGKIRAGDGWQPHTGVDFPFGGWHHFAVVADTNTTSFYRVDVELP